MTRGTYSRVNKQITVNEVRSLDIRKIDKARFIDTGWIDYYVWNDGESVRLRIENSRMTLVDRGQVIYLDKTKCNYGGFRYWFNCPGCNRRSAILYEKQQEFLCRICHKLPYKSQMEGKIDTLIRRTKKIRKRLGDYDDLSEVITCKPKGMHWKTFQKLKKKELAASQEYVEAVITRLNLDREYFYS